MPESEKARKKIYETALEILFRFHVAFKIARIYEPNNLMFLKQVHQLFLLIQAVLKQEGEAFFKLRQSTLFFNNLRLKFSFSNFFVFKFMVTELRKKQIGTMNFHADLTEEALKAFLILLARGEGKEEIPFEAFLREFEKSEIKNITIEKISPYELTQRKEKSAAKVYFLSILHLKEVFEKEQQKEKIRINTTRRLMQSIFNHLIENESFVHGLTNIKNYDEYTLNHSVNVCTLAIALGRRLGLDRNELVDLGISAFFHDVGKLETPLEILNKPTKLDEEERKIIEKHPHHGAQKLVHSEEFRNLPLRAIHVALEHHIKADLTGYPRFSKRNSVNLYSKIVKVVDYFDAITTKRAYRPHVFTRDEALALMLKQSGTEFDPLILKVFVNMMGAYPGGTLVYLDSSEFAIVFEAPADPSLFERPKVKLITDEKGNKINGEIVDLAEVDPVTQRYQRSILKVLDPEKYNIKVSDYFLAQAV